MSSTSALSQTLRSITTTKIHELEKQRDTFAKRRDVTLSNASEQKWIRARLSRLIEDLKVFPDLQGHQLKQDLDHAQKWLEQSYYDPSVAEDRLCQLEVQLQSHLETNGRKLELAHLYSRLLTEWIEAPGPAEAPAADAAEVDSDDSFDVLQSTQKERLDQLRDKFAKVVFEPLETDEVQIDNYLRQLFPGEDGEATLNDMRDSIQRQGNMMMQDHFCLDNQSVKWCIKALLKVEMLNEEKKAALREFLKDEAVLEEIRDVLNMRFRDIENWDWNMGEEGMPVQPRQSLNGKWRVMMDEDVLQAILTHWIGTTWAINFKGTALMCARRTKLLGNLSDKSEGTTKLRYFIKDWFGSRPGSVGETRRQSYENNFFMAPLPSKLFETAGGYDDDDDDVPEDGSDKKSAKDVKQLLLQTMATEVILRRSLDGEVVLLQSDFQWFATGIAHSTVFAVMRFLNFPEKWITFFKKALSPPMDMLDGSPVRTRKRGLPMAHIFEKWLGEMLLFFLDLAVAQNSGMLLYRFHDDLWLAGEPQKCANAWQTMETFAKIMGLDFNKSKTGSVYLTDGKRAKVPSIEKALPQGTVVMNFLVLDPQLGNWIVNREHVQQHVHRLRKQLDGATSVLHWIKTWNSFVSRFFGYSFGEPANCFGRAHLDAILDTHRDLQRQLFHSDETGRTVTEHLKLKISKNLGYNDDIPESWLFMPESLGGLGLKNPFPSLLLLRDGICKDPAESMLRYHEQERSQYEQSKRAFEAMSDRERRKRYKAFFEDEETATLSWADAQTFISFDEFKQYRETSSMHLHTTYKYLLEQPRQSSISRLQRLRQELRGKEVDEEEIVWLLQFFEEELFEKFGGLEIVDRSLLPLGVLKALKERKVTWQMVL